MEDSLAEQYEASSAYPTWRNRMSKEFAEQAVKVLNRALNSDYDAVYNLIEHRTFCNEKLANDPTVQVLAVKETTEYSVGMLGIINGIIGSHPNGWGYAAAVYDVICSEHGKLEKEHDKLRINDDCPHKECKFKLEMGKLSHFEVIDG